MPWEPGRAGSAATFGNVQPVPIVRAAAVWETTNASQFPRATEETAAAPSPATLGVASGLTSHFIGVKRQQARDITRAGGGCNKKTTMPDDSEGMQHRGTYVAPVSVWQPFNQGGQLESERAHGMLTRDLTGPAMRGAKSGADLPKEL